MFHHLCNECDHEWTDDEDMSVCPECKSLDMITTGDEFRSEGGA
jgi:Zn finger protein HypA/HybF involved in hydrogenase expression